MQAKATFNFNGFVNSGFDKAEGFLFSARNFYNEISSESWGEAVRSTVGAELLGFQVAGAKIQNLLSKAENVARRKAIGVMGAIAAVVNFLAWVESIVLSVWGVYVQWADEFVESRTIHEDEDAPALEAVEVVEATSSGITQIIIPKALELSLRLMPLHGWEFRAFGLVLQWLLTLKDFLRGLAVASVEKVQALRR